MNKSRKQILTTITCGFSFIFGWGLTIAGFIVPPLGDVTNSVLWILGQSLLYCGACIGISEHYAAKVKDFEKQIMDKIDKK